MSTPLYDALTALSSLEPLRLHMPGHKGRLSGAFQEIAKIDFTEIAPTGNLYTVDGPIAEAEALFAEAAGAGAALFFSCGATQGIFTMLSAAVGVGGTLLLDRSCHKSVYHGMALLDITPVYLQTPLIEGTALPQPISPALLEAQLIAHPEAKAVLLTTPSYYGIVTPLRPLAELCRAHGVFLLVDQAHGAHFPFAGLPSAAAEGADLCVVSAHKTLPALGSSSILYVGSNAPWDAFSLKQISAVFATSSPSYPILASIDYARGLLEGNSDYARTAALVSALRARINAGTPFHAISPSPEFSLDPCRLTIDLNGLNGNEADALLQKQNIYVELSDERYIVAILTCCDTESDLNRLFDALCILPSGRTPPEVPEMPPAPLLRCSIRNALFGPSERVPLGEAAGRIAAELLAPYPPGIPIVAPGEEITKIHIACLQKKRYTADTMISCIPPLQQRRDCS